MNISFLKKIYQKMLRPKAFSLIELSIVIVIISILISGALSVAISSANVTKIKNNNDKISKIYQALKTYLAANKKLPCPAPINVVKSTTDTYGTADITSDSDNINCASSSSLAGYVVYGMVPIKDLNLGVDFAEDDYGSKFLYVVDKRFATASTFGIDESNSGLMQVWEYNSSSYQINTDKAIFLIISYGANKLGAYPVDSTIANAEPTDTDEAANNINGHIDDGIGGIIYSNFVSSSKRSDVFDDILFYKTRNDIALEANVLDLIYCPSVSETYYSTPMNWSASKYGQVVPSTVACPSGYQQTALYPTKKCGAFGNWQAGVIDPCTYSANATAATACTGGDSVATVGTKTIHTFTSSGNLVCSSSKTIDYLVVGGGGGGGGVIMNDGGKKGGDEYGGGGGGGGGGIKTGSYSVAAGNSFTVTVGNGGSGGSAASGSSGTSSSIIGASLSATATAGNGGHYGGNQDGVGGTNGTGDSVTVRSGGASQNSSHGAGGGGASMDTAGGAGGKTNCTGVAEDHGTHCGGAGAAGTSNSLSGASVVYGSGGGGGAGGANSEGTQGYAGSGSGGIGAKASVNAGNGVANRGGGGGGGAKSATSGNGGTGVVIVSYTTL